MATSNFISSEWHPLFVRFQADNDDDLELYAYLVEKELADENKLLENYEIQIIGGYYEGVQLYVKQKHETDNIEFEKQKVLEILNRIKNEYDMIELVVVAKFSNGETIYKEKGDSNNEQ